jgi:integrase
MERLLSIGEVAQGEIKMLRQMIYWAMNERLTDGYWLLESNPLRGVKLPKEEDPRRPVATYDRFLKLREAAQDMAATARQQRGRNCWKRWEMALVLAEATGARIGAISGLRWSRRSTSGAVIEWFPSPRRWRRSCEASRSGSPRLVTGGCSRAPGRTITGRGRSSASCTTA